MRWSNNHQPTQTPIFVALMKTGVWAKRSRYFLDATGGFLAFCFF